MLQKSGEPTNGNSPFQSIALTYLNRVHQVIRGGGSFLNLNVDEPWIWARHHFPIIVELQPAFTSGYINTQYGSNNISFTIAPTNPYTGSASSVEGWHLQASNYSTVYKIMQHTAGSTVAQLDSSFVDTIAQGSFRCMQLDYPISPVYLYIDNSNDQLDFAEITTTTAGSTTAFKTAVMQHGSYTPPNLASSVAAQMNLSGTASYGASYDTVANTFFITCNQTFYLLGATGTYAGRRSTIPSLGFDVLDQTGAQSYTGAYFPNQVGRLIEPFKMFMVNWWGEHFCYSTDPIRMQEDYPISQITQRFPDRFARMQESMNGQITVRFNAYPIQLTKLQIDWVKQPVDLQNNTASMLSLPRQDIDAAIHGASAMVLYDKNDSKWQTTLDLCAKQLDAMKKKNHTALLRTGQEFGQIVPRQDLNRAVRRFNYGYTVNGSTAAAVTSGAITTNLPVTLTYMNFQGAGTVASVTATTVANNVTLFSLLIKLSTGFTGTGITGLTLNVGTAANPTQFINGFSPITGTSSSVLANYFPSVSTPIIVTMQSTGAVTSALKQGALTLYFLETVNP